MLKHLRENLGVVLVLAMICGGFLLGIGLLFVLVLFGL